jgi:hypothetical protein
MLNSVFAHRLWLAGIAAVAVGHVAMGQVLYQENFDTDPSANWQFNGSGTGNSADFFFDYGTVGVPPAPGGTSTRGLKVTANLAAGVFGGGSASPIGLTLPSEYVLTAYVWQNSVGPFPGGGSGSTQLTNMSVGVSGVANEFQGGSITGVQFSVTGEGGSSADWRAYSALMPNGAGATLSTTNTPAVYPAGSLNNTAAYYTAAFAGQSPPAAQAALFASQTGATSAGSPGFLWNLWEITKTESTISWKINGTEFATVASNLFPPAFGGNNIAFGQADINATSSTDPNAGALIFGLFDSITVTAVPEPSATAVVGLVVFGLAGYARRRAVSSAR